MAFQTGTQVNPSLGALDFSGFTNAANIQASSLASLGDAIGGAIEKYNRKKEDEVNIKALAELLGDPKLAKAVYNDDVVRSVYLFDQKQQDAKELANIKAQNDLSATEEKINLVMRANPYLNLQESFQSLFQLFYLHMLLLVVYILQYLFYQDFVFYMHLFLPLII